MPGGSFASGPRTARAQEAQPHVPAAEARLLELLNADRAAHGLVPLERDDELAAVARWRSEDMAARRYFGHDIGGFEVFDVLREQGVAFRLAGENLAATSGDGGVAAAEVEAALMRSPAHRANILRPEFTHVGVGVALGPDGRVLYTQLFTQPL